MFLHVHWHHVNVATRLIPNHPSVDRRSAYARLLQIYEKETANDTFFYSHKMPWHPTEKGLTSEYILVPMTLDT